MNNNLRNNRFWLNRAVAVVGVVLLSGLQAFGATATGIKRPEPGETVEVLVQYATQPTEEQYRRVTDRNGRIRAAFRTRPGGSLRCDSGGAGGSRSQPRCGIDQPQSPVSANLDHAMCQRQLQPAHQLLHRDRPQQGLRASASPLSIAASISSHPDFAHFASSTLESSTASPLSAADTIRRDMVMARMSRALQPARTTSPTAGQRSPCGSKASPRTPI